MMIEVNDNIDHEGRIMVADALNEVYAFIRTIPSAQSGLDGFHADACLMAASFIRPLEV